MSTSVILTLVYRNILAWSRRVRIIEVGLYYEYYYNLQDGGSLVALWQLLIVAF